MGTEEFCPELIGGKHNQNQITNFFLLIRVASFRLEKSWTLGIQHGRAGFGEELDLGGA